MIVELLSACPQLTILATSREPLGVPGELSWRVPSLSLADDAIELFAERARRARPDFVVNDDNAALVQRSAAAWMACRWPSSLPRHGFARCRWPRFGQPARPLPVADRRCAHRGTPPADAARFGGLVACPADRTRAGLVPPAGGVRGGFDLDAAQAVGGDSAVERYQLLDQLSLLVDKSLVIAEDTGGRMRYRLLETVRQYAQEKLGESGEADPCGPVTATTTRRGHELLSRRGGPAMSIASSGPTPRSTICAPHSYGAARTPSSSRRCELASSLQPLWLARRQIQEGTGRVRSHSDRRRYARDVAPAVWVRAVADQATLAGGSVIPPSGAGRTRRWLSRASLTTRPCSFARSSRGDAPLFTTRGGPGVFR